MFKSCGLQAVFHCFLANFHQTHSLSPDQEKACRNIEQCRVETLGGLQQGCDLCGYKQPQYN